MKLKSLNQVQWTLSCIWLIWGGALFLLVLIQTLFGKYSTKPTIAWEWLLPSIIPTISLILGVLFSKGFGLFKNQIQVNYKTFYISIGLSIFYLATITLTLFLQPIFSSDPEDVFSISNLWLAPLQGIITGSIGVLFVEGSK